MALEEGEQKKAKKGGLRTMPFILANEVCDRFAEVGFHANMITYLTQQLHMPLVQASNVLSGFKGTSSLTPIIGGLVADSFAGRFWTITACSLIYQLGMISLTVSSAVPLFRPPPCDGNRACRPAAWWQLCVLYLSLLFGSIGAGGIRPCVVPFGADQFDLARGTQGPRKESWSFFNLYYFTMGLAGLVALTVVVWVQDNVGWGWGLGIPTIAMALSVTAFVAGYPLYVNIKPGGSPLVRLAQVVVAAIRKRKAARPDDPNLLYQNTAMDAPISTAGRLHHTNQLLFLDRAAIVTEGDEAQPGQQPRLWRLSTVHRVEELKSLIRMLPIWASGVLLATATSHNYTFGVLQARSMDRRLSPSSSSFQIPAASISAFSVVPMLLSLVLYDRALVPVARRLTGHPAGITYLQRMGAGLALAALSTAAAALVEAKRKAAAARHGLLDRPHAVVPISVLWLTPQYGVHGVAEAFMAVGHLEFLYDQAPESMRSTAAALFWLAVAIGNYLGSVLLAVVHACTRGSGDWLQDNINRGKLDYYYWLVAALQLANLLYYALCAALYTFKPLERVAPDTEAQPAVSSTAGDGSGHGHGKVGDADDGSREGQEQNSPGGRR